MKNKLTVFFALTSIILAAALIIALVCKKDESRQWTKEQAWQWKEASGWHIGFSYVPSYAVNQYEIWQKETFNPDVLDKELALAEQVGYSIVRIYLMEGVWYVDKDGFKSRIDTFLKIADSHGLKTVFTFFSNGGNHDLDFEPGPQPAPKAGIHGSGVWVPSPGKKVIENPEEWPKLKNYVQDILRTFKNDKRIYYWCLCNEPENFKNGCDVSKFMPEVYRWAWEIRPSQPLTSPVWQRPGKGGTSTKLDIVAFVCENSDIITFHCYHTPDECQKEIEMLSRFGRPMVCQEYLARNFNNTFFNILPILKEHNIDAINWGLVNNANHYHYPWGHKPEDPEPDVWFHDVFHSDFTPYDPAEIDFLKEMTQAGITSSSFGALSTGEEATRFHLVNTQRATMDVTNYGARIISITMPDRNGVLDDVIVGPGTLEAFETGDRFFGPVIGRYGNRIDHASFVLDGTRYDLAANENFDGEPVQCHGGPEGFDRKMWEAEPLREEGRVGVRFHRVSPDGEQGYPGNLDCYVTYWLTDSNEVCLEYRATTDKPTVVNLSNHSYFNLRGRHGSYVMEHLLQVEADTCVQNNLHYCPDLLLPVEDSPFDFREPHRVDYRIDMPNRHLEIMHGMSACWVIRDWDGTLRKAADLYDPQTGRGVETWTTEPALLTYTGRGFNVDKYPYGKYGPIDKYAGMLLETIHFPDSPNQPRFPSTVLRPGEQYHAETRYRFYAR